MVDATLQATEILDLCGVQPADRDECRQLLSDPAAVDAQQLARALDTLRARLGTFSSEAPADELSPQVWLAGYLRFVPELVRWHRDRRVPAAVTAATLADLGRNLAIRRRVHGDFGLENWHWPALHLSGALYQIGRLQYALYNKANPIPGRVDSGDWVLGLHIPETGALGSDAVQESLAAAATFFARHFPDRPVSVGICVSWLLDPYLAEQLPADSNIARFASRFTSYRAPSDAPTDALYFTFRTRDLTELAQLPTDTALQRIVVGRIRAGGTWQVGNGWLDLPDAGE